MAFAQQKGGVTTPLLLNLLVIYGGRLVSLQKIQKGYKQVAKMQIRIIYKLLFSYEFNVYVYIYINILYRSIRHPQKHSTIIQVLSLGFFSFNARPPRKQNARIPRMQAFVFP